MNLHINRFKCVVALLLLCCFQSIASEINKLYIPDVTVFKEKTISLPVYMNNTAEITAIQFTLETPQQFVLSNTGVLTDRKIDHEIVVREISDQNYMIMVYSPQNAIIQGNSGQLISLDITIPSTVNEGESYNMTLKDVVLSTTDGTNVMTEFSVGAMTVAKSPDLTISDVKTDKTAYTPGSTINVSWNVKNIGARATEGGWKEQVYLVNAENSKLLGTVYYESTLLADAGMTRQASIILPDIIGIDGQASIMVKLIPNSDAGEGPESTGNNTSNSSTITIARKLVLSLPDYAVDENTVAIRCKLSRSGNITNAETYTITNHNTSRITLPANVTIEKNLSGVVFYANLIDNTTLDADSIATMTITSNFYPEITDTIVIEDNELATLELSLSTDSVVEGSQIPLIIKTNRVTNTPVVVNLTSDSKEHFSFPQNIIIPAGESSVTVEISTVDDSTPNLTIDASIVASAAKHENGYEYILIGDNDIPDIELDLSVDKISESNGIYAISATLRRTNLTNSKIIVELSDDSNGRIYYSTKKIELASGVQEATFNLGAIDNALVDGDQEVTIVAAVYIASCNCSSTGTSKGVVARKVTILDNDGASLSIKSSTTAAIEGKELTLTVSRNTSTDTDLAVTISSDSDDMLDYVKNVTIPAGKSSVDVIVSVLSNDISGDSKAIMFTAECGGYTNGLCYVMLTDQTLPDAEIVKISVDSTEIELGKSVVLSIDITNTGAIAMADCPIAIFVNNASTPTKTIYINKAIEVEETITVTTKLDFAENIGSYSIKAQVNYNKPITELVYNNNHSEVVNVNVLPNFSAKATTDKAVYKQGETITINGVVTGVAAANAKVEVYLINNSARQTLSATADAEGKFTITYTPYALQSGHFVVGACFPGENSHVEQASFDVYGLKRTSTSQIFHNIIVEEQNTGSIRLTNPGQLDLTDVKVELLSVPENYTITFEPLSTISGGQTVNLGYTLIANKASEGTEWELISARITTAEEVTLDLTLYCYGRNAKGKLKANVNNINTTMTKGATREYTVTITNIGKGETGKITLSIPNIDWIKTVTPIEMSSLKSEESATIIFSLSPTNDMQLNVPQTGTIGINCENGDGIPLNYRIEPVSESTGTLLVDVCDEYTYNTTEAPHVSGAGVVIKHPTTNAIIAQGTTDANGLYTVELPEGYYNISVTESNHESYSNLILVDPGKKNKHVVNISFKAISVDWDVVETEVKDEYKIVTTVNYETNVPMPVVIMDLPESIDGDNMALGETIVINCTLTNKGLITAQNVNLILPEDSQEWHFEALSHTAPFELAPQQSVYIPIAITRLNKDELSTYQFSTRASNIVDYYGACMSQLVARYEWSCGEELKSNAAAERMAMKMCAYAATGAVIFDIISQLVSNVPSITLPPVNIPTTNNKVTGGGSGTNPITTGETFTICDTCDAQLAEGLLEVIIGFSNIADFDGMLTDAAKMAQELRDNPKEERKIMTKAAFQKFKETLSDIYENLLKQYADSKIPRASEVIDGLKSIIKVTELQTEDCPKDTVSKSLKTMSIQAYSNNNWQKNYRAVGKKYVQYLKCFDAVLVELFGDDIWYNEALMTSDDFMNYIFNNDEITLEQALAVKPENVTNEQVALLLERLDNFAIGVEEGNTIRVDIINDQVNNLNLLNEEAISAGYKSLTDQFAEAIDICSAKLNNMSSNSVCASITLQFEQSMVMTRQAFRGTLSVFNGHTSLPMTDVKLNLEVRDENGNLATSHEFQINAETLDSFTGELSLDGDWSLEANKTGVATVLFIPTKYAAPTEAMDYSFGGSLTYIDPFTGYEVTRDLYPVTLTVKPSPILDMTYFMQRDIWGDDALTDVVEPSVPAEFALLINNIGYGDAKNVVMTTKQPEIVENEKGYNGVFELLSSQLNGQKHTLALGGSVATEFGTIPAHSTSYAQWWIQNQNLGHFCEYDVTATHVTSYGNEDLSLLNNVTIHELIRSLRLGATENDTMIGFLVNDIQDLKDLPDMLYKSDGSILPVSQANNSSINKNSETEYTLSVTATEDGWVYGSVLDPTLGNQEIVSVVRNSDGSAINVRNFWQTDRTLLDSKDPLYEYRLHFADTIEAGNESYTIVFTPKPKVLLAVESYSGVPEELAISPVETITVKFNKAIDPATFTSEDLTLTVQGKKQDVSVINIETVDNNVFNINMSQISAGDGYYVLTVQTAGITDTEGYAGKNGKTASWNMFMSGKVHLAVKAQPIDAGLISVLQSETEQPDSVTSGGYTLDYGKEIKLSASANEGYKFLSWTVAGESVSTATELSRILTGHETVIANFEAIQYQVNIISEQGTVTGGNSAIYKYGTTLTLNVEPIDGYEFVCWNVDGKDVYDKTLVVTVKSDMTITANCSKIATTKLNYNFAKGWNWMSVNVDCDELNNLPALLSPLGSMAMVFESNDAGLTYNYGWSGNLTNISPNSMYRIQTKIKNTLSVEGIPTESSTITINPGWNWIGYTPIEEQSLDMALSSLILSDGDMIKSQNEFAVYDGASWIGNLKTLKPGLGYQYYSDVTKSFSYTPSNNAVSEISIDLTNEEIANNSWSCNLHQYSDNMATLAKIENADDGQYEIGVFANGECRSISTEVDSLHHIMIYGDEPVELLFKVLDVINQVEYNVIEKYNFNPGSLGTLQSPISLTIDETNGIYGVHADNIVLYPNPAKEMIYIKGINDVNTLTITDSRGTQHIRIVNPEVSSGINVSVIPVGVYIMTIETDEQIIHKRFIRTGIGQ